MKNKIVIAHAGKTEKEIEKIKKIVKGRFRGSTVVTFNYSDFSQTNTQSLVDNAEAVVVSGFGRLITENGVAAIRAARKNNIPVYFVMELNRDEFDDQKACLWAYEHSCPSAFDTPVITELTSKDEKCTNFYGRKALILPTYAM